MKTKSMLIKRISYILVSTIFMVVLSCKKDNNEKPTLENVTKEHVQEWLNENPVSKVVKPDWSKFEISVINGKKVAKLPVTPERVNILEGHETELKMQNRVSANQTPTGYSATQNPNYRESHPPELVFGEDKNGKIKGYLLNFVPTETDSDNGDDGIWTGKLYEWNMTGDTMMVVEYLKNKIVHKSLIQVVPKSVPNYNGTSFSSPNNKLSYAKPNATSSIWSWLGNILGDVWQGLNFVFYHLGVPGAWIPDPNFGGNYLIRTWDFSSDNQQTINYIAADYSMYGMFFQGSNNGFMIPTPTHADILAHELGLSTVEVANYFITNQALQNEVHIYFANYGRTPENIEHLNWAINFLYANPTISLQTFKQQYLIQQNASDGEQFNADYWNDPNLNIPQQDLPSWTAFSANYPTISITGKDLLEEIGDAVGGLYDPQKETNTCAIRVSYALNKCNIDIPNIPAVIENGVVKFEPQTLKGADGKYYFIRAAELNAFLKKTFGTNDGANNTPVNNKHTYITKAAAGTKGQNLNFLLGGKKGIYSMVSSKPKWATGHADMLKPDCTCGTWCYFDGPIAWIDIWELQ